ncbi:MAG: translation initiation factor IF-2 [Bacteroidetes bacterium]|nr:MAG: translation initiation factor IF-2 [Bacteroidota bacterium]
MAEVKKQTYRLFKVAKEFNVSIDTIVEHLHGKGHEVDSSPNTKLPGELYDVLLKEFASEKQLRQKAEEIIEKRREENRVGTRVKTGPDGVELEETDPENSHVSAEQLRHSIRPRRRKLTPSAKKPEEIIQAQKEIVEPKPPLAKKTEPLTGTEEVKTEVPEAPPISENDVSKEVVAEPVEEKKAEPKLKIVGKIELDKLDTGKKGRKSRKKEAPKKKETPEVQEELAEQQEAPVLEESGVSEETKAESPAEEAPPKTKRRRKRSTTDTPAEEQQETEAVAEKVEVTEQTEAEIVEESSEEEDVMRADDRTPNLRGLKVMGKIELPTDKPKRKRKTKAKEEEEKTTTTENGQSGETEGDDADKKKRRRRRRKRKRKSPVKADVKDSGKGSDGSGGKSRKKEKVSEQEVEKSIRETRAQMSQAPSRQRQRLRRQKREEEARKREEFRRQREEEAKVLELTEFITANEFANLLGVPVNEIITKSFELGMMVSINQRLDAELLSILAEEYGYRVEFIDVTEKEFEEEEIEDAPEDLQPRSPIITVMGHVDHGKTTLLDYLRKTNVTSEEAGGITQHIGAYEVKLKSGRNVTFLDTPGHEAFTAMRARGAKVTDVVIVVIAADDAVMPQTREAINHAQAAEVPMVFAINKIDKPGADPERIKGQLAEMNLLVEDWGGKYQSQEISALTGQNVDELLEKVILEADMLELKANPNRPATGTVIESRLDKGRGNVATLLVQKGTLKIGDEMVAGIHYGKVRALIDQKGERIEEAGPSKPVQMLGLSGQPQAGDKFQVFTEDGKAKTIAQKRSELFREQQFRQTKHITLEEITRRRAIGNFKELNIIIRGDVDGSVEALAGALLKLSTEEVQVNILLKSVGAITESDVMLASASDAIIIAFNVRPNATARQLAEREGIEMRTYSVIYDAINDVKDALEGLLSPEIKEEILGTAEVREVFKVSKVGTVAGCYVTSGKLNRDDKVRIIRDGVVIYDSKFSSLKRFKDDVKEVIHGQEFGATVENYNDIKVGDVLEAYKVNEIRRKL